MNKHKHNWNLNSHSGIGGIWKCTSCKETRTRNWSKKERKLVRASDKKMFNPSRNEDVHYWWHKFIKEVIGCQEYQRPVGDYKLIEKAKKWIAKYPQSKAQAIRVDDDYFAGSVTILFPHFSDYRFMGTTVLHIPQCTGGRCSRFFLYPNHFKDLILGLNQIKILQKKKYKKQAVLKIPYGDTECSLPK